MWMCVLVISLEKSSKQSRVASSSQHICQLKSLSHGTSGLSGYSCKVDGENLEKKTWRKHVGPKGQPGWTEACSETCDTKDKQTSRCER